MKSKSNNAYFQKLLAFDVSRKFYVLAFDTILFLHSTLLGALIRMFGSYGMYGACDSDEVLLFTVCFVGKLLLLNKKGIFKM